MLQKDQRILDDADLDYAIHFKQPVIVFQNGEIIDYGGVVESYTDESVRINGVYFLRRNCEIRVR